LGFAIVLVAVGSGMRIGVGFGADKLAIRRAAPKIGTAGLKKSAGEGTERANELAGLAALKSRAGQLK
jgi:hypothetical protein